MSQGNVYLHRKKTDWKNSVDSCSMPCNLGRGELSSSWCDQPTPAFCVSSKYVDRKWIILDTFGVPRMLTLTNRCRKKSDVRIDLNWRIKRILFLTIPSPNQPWWISHRYLNVLLCDQCRLSLTSRPRARRRLFSDHRRREKLRPNHAWSMFVNKSLPHPLNQLVPKHRNSNKSKSGMFSRLSNMWDGCFVVY